MNKAYNSLIFILIIALLLNFIWFDTFINKSKELIIKYSNIYELISYSATMGIIFITELKRRTISNEVNLKSLLVVAAVWIIGTLLILA
ncbi:hypothetical protein [Tissierella sp. Yu-01]|uniref:hypothetical protein n=1 Tax=Tissierella sp. Yu-01 TaxID=3035694 RepID=UPI00240D67EA|nr:hypothetical protein [Tissierella sp. Yu-01]WFA08229.1 hypothetical protein P3962_10875 [Tissierella sp. Yu-01]